MAKVLYSVSIGQAVIITTNFSTLPSWYTDDVYYVIKKHPKGTIKCDSTFDENGNNKNNLIEVHTINGIKLIAHESKFLIAPPDRVREDKLQNLLK